MDSTDPPKTLLQFLVNLSQLLPYDEEADARWSAISREYYPLDYTPLEAEEVIDDEPHPSL